MIIVRIIGGLGNQLFQYALLIALKKRTSEEVKYDLGPMTSYNLFNGFELRDIFSITASAATSNEVKRIGRYFRNYREWQLCHHLFPWWRNEIVEWKSTKFYSKVLAPCQKNLIYDGYWQCYQYFDDAKEEILKEYTYKEPLDERNSILAKQMLEDHASVSIHIRRGDYLKDKKYKGLCDVSYYRRAIEMMKELIGEKVNAYIFSNDLPWCKLNIIPLLPECRVIMVDWNRGKDSYKDMRLMHYCRMNIIAASSFSWWGAYMNQRPDKIVVAPKVWINLPLEYDVQLPEWIII